MSELGYYHNSKHIDIIFQIVKLMGCNKYLELGIWNGSNISEIHKVCEYCVGVDILDCREFFDYIYRQTTTDDFFAQNTEMFDIIFIDADHNFEAVKKDFANSLKVLNKLGIILIHDTDPFDEAYSRPGLCGDSYKIIDWIAENYDGLNVLTLPITEAGLTIVNRKNERRWLLK